MHYYEEMINTFARSSAIFFFFNFTSYMSFDDKCCFFVLYPSMPKAKRVKLILSLSNFVKIIYKKFSFLKKSFLSSFQNQFKAEVFMP